MSFPREPRDATTRRSARGLITQGNRRFCVPLSDVYFSMLDLSWGVLLAYCVLAYAVVIGLWFLVTLTVRDDLDGRAVRLGRWPRTRCLAFAVENIVTMGAGRRRRASLGGPAALGGTR